MILFQCLSLLLHQLLVLVLFIRKFCVLSCFCNIINCILLNFSLILDPSQPIGMSFLYLFMAIWTSFVLAEQMCISFLLVFKSRINTVIAVSYILCISLALASGTVRSYKGLQPWLQENTKGTHTKYASTLLHSVIFLSRNMNCEPSSTVTCPVPADYLHDRLGRSNSQVIV